MSAYTVRMTSGARNDLRGIHAYIAENDSHEKANYVAQSILQVILTFKELPMRGVYPPELIAIGIRNFRELFFKPYRIIYTIRETTVFIALIADGRRDMHSLLASRLLRP